VLQCVAARGSALQSVEFSCSVSCVPRQQSRGVHRRAAAVAVCCSALQCAALRCSALQCVAACHAYLSNNLGAFIFEQQKLQCVAVCCSVLQCVAVCCSVLKCVPVRYSVFQFVAVCHVTSRHSHSSSSGKGCGLL